MVAQQPNPIREDLLARLPASPDSYLQKIDLVREAALLVQFDRAAYRASFLDDRILTPATKGAWLPVSRLMEAARRICDPRPLHFIFHTGHVGSTLVSRLLDETGAVLSLREPLPLRTLAEAHDALNQADSLLSPAQFQAICGTLMSLWSRAYDSAGNVIVKATSNAGRVAGVLLEKQKASRAIYMNLRAEPYLATLLAGQNSPLDLRGHGPERMRRLRSRIGSDIMPLYGLSMGELAAMSWLCESWSQRDAVTGLTGRVLAVDFDAFLSDVPSHMEQILGHFGLPHEPRYLSEVARSPVLTRYSKAAEFAYSPAHRAEILHDARRRHADEIRKGMDWLERLAKAEPAVAEVLNGIEADSG